LGYLLALTLQQFHFDKAKNGINVFF